MKGLDIKFTIYNVNNVEFHDRKYMEQKKDNYIH